MKSSSPATSEFFDLYRICFFTAGPWKTISRSSGVSSRNGTSVRTPIARQTSVISDHISEFHGATAPPSIVSDSSGTSAASLTARTTPTPPHVRHAPPLLNEKLSALGPSNSAPHSGQTIFPIAAVSIDGGQICPFGHLWLPSRENMSRRLLSSSVIVPKVLRTPGTAGRWRSASAGGMFSMLSIFASAACVMRRRV